MTRQIDRSGKKLSFKKKQIKNVDRLLKDALGQGDRDINMLERKTELVNPFLTSERNRLRNPNLKLYDPEATYDSDTDQVRKSKTGTLKKSYIQ